MNRGENGSATSGTRAQSGSLLGNGEAARGELAGKAVVLGVTGGIAAYKAAELCRLLVKAGAQVRVILTEAAGHFITPLTMQTLSGHPVARDLFDLTEESEIGHIRLADEADLIVIAPATADFIARLAAGMANDLLAAVVLASRAPVLLAPAMNVNMWENPLTQANLERLLGPDGGGRFSTIGPDRGALACGWIGPGRLIEPAEIATAATAVLAQPALRRGALAGRRVVVTAGPTLEAIDDVRFLGNRSSGKMGFALAQAAATRGAEVVLVAGPVALSTPPGIARRIDVESAEQMQRALGEVTVAADVVVMAAAVSDFRPATRVAGKLSRRTGAAPAHHGETTAPPLSPPLSLSLSLTANPDLLAQLGHARRGSRPLLVGFAAEAASDAAMTARAQEKLVEKQCDMVVANDIGAGHADGTGFGSDDNQVTLVFADGHTVALARASKLVIAGQIWDHIEAALAGREPVSSPVPVASTAAAPPGDR